MSKIDKTNVEIIMSLTPLQQGILYHYIKEADANLYFEQLRLNLEGDIDKEAFQQAWNEVFQANEMLRATYRWDKVNTPLQVVLKKVKPPILFHDLSEGEAALQTVLDEDRQATFDLSQTPFRVTLCRLHPAKYCMIVSFHHIICDGWSTGIILEEFFNAYFSIRSGHRWKTPQKPGFNTFIKSLQENDSAEQEQYWKNYLEGISDSTQLPMKRQQNGTETTGGSGIVSLAFPPGINERLEEFCGGQKVTVAAVLYTAWGLLLHRYLDKDDIIFGITLSGRNAKISGIESMVGLFIDTLPLRMRVAPGQTAAQAAEQVHIAMRAGEAFNSFPLTKIKEILNCPVYRELFDNIMVIENYPLADLKNRLMDESHGLSIESFVMDETTHYDLTLGIGMVSNGESRLSELSFSYRYAAFDEATVRRMAGHLVNILDDLLEHPDKPAIDLEFMSEEEKTQIMTRFNDTATPFERDKTVVQLFTRQAAKTPHSIAAVGLSLTSWAFVQISYAELDSRSNFLAHRLNAGIKAKGRIIALRMERSVEMFIAILAVLKAGAAYMPIDPQAPEERARYMLEDSNAAMCLDSADVGKMLRNNPIDMIEPPEGPAPDDLCYVLYTSGSSGRPKGVMVEHRNLSAYVFAFSREHQVRPGDVMLQQNAYTFDTFMEEVFPVLLNGGRLAMAQRNEILDIDALCDFIDRNQVNIIDCSPLLLNEINHSHRRLSSTHTYISGGDTLKSSHVTGFLKEGRVLNGYGPTESTVSITFYRCRGDERGEIPIGKPIANWRVFILDRRGRPAPIGVPGELCTAGPGVTRGYINGPELTAEKFIPNPFTPHPSPIYKTGDLASWRADGNIDFLGRIDQQVKIRGYRIQLEEIEAQLKTLETVKDAMVIAAENKRGDRYLCAYYVVAPPVGEPVNTGELRDHLTRTLPVYMVPAYFVAIDQIPLTLHGKIDRSKLPPPAIVDDEEMEPPETALEVALTRIWAGVLDVEPGRIGIDANFFHLGGHSLRATMLTARIHKQLGVKIPLAQLFRLPTVRAMARYIKEHRQQDGAIRSIPVAAVEKKEYYVLSAAQRRHYVVQQLQPQSTLYNVPMVFPLKQEPDLRKLEEVFVQLIRRHESLRTSFLMVAEQPFQRVHDDVPFKLEYRDTGAGESVDEAMVREFMRPFDLSRPPLLRVRVVSTGEGFFLLMDIHHIIFDEFSYHLLMRQFRTLYRGGNPGPLPLVQYKDYACWQNRPDVLEALKPSESYWLERFSDGAPQLDLHTDYPRSNKSGEAGARVFYTISRYRTAALKKLALQANCSLFMVLLAIFKLLLSRWCGQEDIAVGVPTAVRPHLDLESIIGMFVNMLVMRNKVEPGLPFNRFLEQVKQNTLDAFEHRQYQYDQLVAKLAGKRDLNRNQLFDVVFNLETLEAHENEEKDYVGNYGAAFDLILTVIEMNGKLHMVADYAAELFEPGTIDKKLEHYGEILDQVLETPAVPVKDIRLTHDLVMGDTTYAQEDYF